MSTEKNVKLTAREKLSIALLLFIIQIIKPMGYSHELDKMLKDFNNELKNN
jgi:hypothetical protein